MENIYYNQGKDNVITVKVSDAVSTMMLSDKSLKHYSYFGPNKVFTIYGYDIFALFLIDFHRFMERNNLHYNLIPSEY